MIHRSSAGRRTRRGALRSVPRTRGRDLRRMVVAVLVGIAVSSTSGVTAAEAQIRPGIQASYAVDQFNGVWGLGGRVVVGIPLVPLRVAGSAEYFFPRCSSALNCRYWQANANLLLTLPVLPIPLFRYVGVGWNRQRVEFAESATHKGINIVVGADASQTTFFELRYELLEGPDANDQFVITVGMLFL